MMAIVKSRAPSVPVKAACQALGLNRSTWYLRHQPAETKPVTQPLQRPQPRALSVTERQTVVELMNSERFRDQPPTEIYHTLLDEGHYVCSVSTMHRLLRSSQCNGDRRQQVSHGSQPIPRLKACRPNEVWTWDITKLPLKFRGIYLSLYVVMDLYSRFILAWMVSRKENSGLSRQLIAEAHDRYRISHPLTLHQDRGAPMIAQTYLDLLGELTITASHSRPRVSNDNAMSESQFKTMKYQPDYPRRFDSLDHARRWCEEYVGWYNFQHYHGALAGFTPSQVFTEQHLDIAKLRQDALDTQYQSHPERFVKGRPLVRLPPAEVFINPLINEDNVPDPQAAVNFPTLNRCKNKLSS